MFKTRSEKTFGEDIGYLLSSRNKGHANSSTINLPFYEVSACFVRSCCTGFWAILMAALLSQYNFIGMFTGIRRSSRILFNHSISQTPLAIALYSPLALLLALHFVFCFAMWPYFPRHKYNILTWISCR